MYNSPFREIDYKECTIRMINTKSPSLAMRMARDSIWSFLVWDKELDGWALVPIGLMPYKDKVPDILIRGYDDFFGITAAGEKMIVDSDYQDSWG